MGKWVIEINGKPLSGFHPNDMPNFTKRGYITAKAIFPCSYKSFNIYDTQEDAIQDIDYMFHTVMEPQNQCRYNKLYYLAGQEVVNYLKQAKVVYYSEL